MLLSILRPISLPAFGLMPSDMDRPPRQPRDFSKRIARLEISVRNTIIAIFRRRARHLLLILPVLAATIFFLRTSSSSELPTSLATVSQPASPPYFPPPTASNSNIDLCFFSSTTPPSELSSILPHIIRSFVVTSDTLGVTPWLAHRTLLGWFWGRKFLPWTPDASSFTSPCSLSPVIFHISVQDVTHLAQNYNHTFHLYEEYGTTYLLDVNPNYVDRAVNRPPIPENSNVVDVRWIDTKSGMFIDILAVEVVTRDVLKGGGKAKGVTAKGKKFLISKDGCSYEAKLVYPLQKSFFEGVNCYVPQAGAVLLAQEYGQRALTSRISKGYNFDDNLQTWILTKKTEPE